MGSIPITRSTFKRIKCGDALSFGEALCRNNRQQNVSQSEVILRGLLIELVDILAVAKCELTRHGIGENVFDECSGENSLIFHQDFLQALRALEGSAVHVGRSRVDGKTLPLILVGGVVAHVCDIVAVMYLGHIVEMAPSRKLFKNPKHSYTKALLSSIPSIDPENKSKAIELKGEIPSALNPPSGCVFRTRCPNPCDNCREGKTEMGLIEVEPGHWVDQCCINCG